MLSVDEALAAIAPHVHPLAPVERPLAATLGLVLGEDITSDIDSPPYDKAMMDGFAIVADDTSDTRQITAEIMAGDAPAGEVTPGTAIRIMTGAPIPAGATAVIPVEQTELTAANTVRLLATIPPGKHIMTRASAMRVGQTVLRAGSRITPSAIALLAEAGAARVKVIPPPRVAVLATGNELVPCGQLPTGAQIRNTNGPALVAAITAAGAHAIELPVARDELAATRDLIRQGLDADILVITGGVSAGVKDLVPQALADCGVKQVFHKVNLKPGKPIWFGVTEGDKPKLVFGLPGNPVSGLVCFRLFVRPALEMMMARRQALTLETTSATLTHPHTHRGGRETYRPATLTGQEVTLTAWQGSADLAGVAGANCLVRLGVEDAQLEAGDEVEVVQW